MDDMDRRRAENVALVVALMTARVEQANDERLEHVVGEYGVEDRLADAALAGLIGVRGPTLIKREKPTGTPALTSLEQRASCLGPDRPDLQGPA